MIAEEFSKCDENYKHTDPKSSMNLNRRKQRKSPQSTTEWNFWKPMIKLCEADRKKNSQ